MFKFNHVIEKFRISIETFFELTLCYFIAWLLHNNVYVFRSRTITLNSCAKKEKTCRKTETASKREHLFFFLLFDMIFPLQTEKLFTCLSRKYVRKWIFYCETFFQFFLFVSVKNISSVSVSTCFSRYSVSVWKLLSQSAGIYLLLPSSWVGLKWNWYCCLAYVNSFSLNFFSLCFDEVVAAVACYHTCIVVSVYCLNQWTQTNSIISTQSVDCLVQNQKFVGWCCFFFFNYFRYHSEISQTENLL